MERWRLVCVIFLLALAESARAGFVITSSRYRDGADDVVVFSALNDGTGNQAGTTKLGSANVTLTSVGHPLIFNFQDIDGDGVNDANVLGYGFSFPTSQLSPMPTGSFIRIGSFAGFTVPAIDSGGATPAPYSNYGQIANPTANYTNINSFNVQGTILGGGVTANSSPVPFAEAFVIADTGVNVSGYLAAEEGSPTAISDANVPEPGMSALLFGLTMFGLRRRNRCDSRSRNSESGN